MKARTKITPSTIPVVQSTVYTLPIFTYTSHLPHSRNHKQIKRAPTTLMPHVHHLTSSRVILLLLSNPAMAVMTVIASMLGCILISDLVTNLSMHKFPPSYFTWPHLLHRMSFCLRSIYTDTTMCTKSNTQQMSSWFT